VEAGRYRTACEVARERLRLLERAEHRRLFEKWLYEGLTPEQQQQLPRELLDRAGSHLSQLVEEGVRSGEEQGWVDGAEAIKRLPKRLGDRSGRP